MLPKLLLTVAIIVVVWFGFRFVNQWLGSGSGGSTKVDDDPPKEQIEDLARCSVCDTYVDAKGNPDCARDDCPMPSVQP